MWGGGGQPYEVPPCLVNLPPTWTAGGGVHPSSFPWFPPSDPGIHNELLTVMMTCQLAAYTFSLESTRHAPRHLCVLVDPPVAVVVLSRTMWIHHDCRKANQDHAHHHVAR